MEDRIKIDLRKCLSTGYEKYLDKAIEEINDKSLLEREIVNHPLEIEEEKMFEVDIDESIKYLTTLKEMGYTSISQRWSGYESNYFEANQFGQETDDEYISRLYEIITKEIDGLKEEEEKARKDQKEIKRLEKRIRELKSKKQ